MDLLFERTMSLEQYISTYKNKAPVFISAHKSQTKQLQEKLGCMSVFGIDHKAKYTSSSSTSADIIDCLEIYKNGDLYVSLKDPNELESFFSEILSDDTPIFMDITSMGVRLLAILLSNLVYALSEVENPPRIFGGYAELKAYSRQGIMNEKDNGKQAQFVLYSDFAPLGPLPNFDSIGSDECDQLWVVLLGFEGYRTDTIDDELTRINDIVALVTIPSLRLGWSNYAIAENAHFLRGVDHREPSIEYVTASSPFSVYNTLSRLKAKYNGHRLQVTPLSTKANSLGALLYALNNPECLIVFDNALESSRNREERTDIYHVYEITEPLKRASLEGEYD